MDATSPSIEQIGPKDGEQQESGHDRILQPVVYRKLTDLKPSPENDRVYRPVDPADPDVRALAADIRMNKVLEPLVITQDSFILSGHRRHVAAKLARQATVPCRVEPFNRADDPDRFLRLLVSYNSQREKDFSEKLREEVVSLDREGCYTRLKTKRAERSAVEVETLELEDYRPRASISAAKQPMLRAALRVLIDRREYWPLSDRTIHYALLNSPPLRHASKPKSRYRNDRKSFSDLCDLLTRARLEGSISFGAIADETRPVIIWDVYRDPKPFLRNEVEGFCRDYHRDLLQSQPNHIEVVVEKNTVASICKRVCAEYCIPMTSGRGFCSLDPRYKINQRYRRSGKEQLILLVVSDFDPEGEVIAESLARSLRDDFDISNIVPIKVALTAEQVKEYDLPPGMKAKAGSSNRKKFVARYGEHVWELEALPPDILQDLLDDAVRGVLDVEAYNHEVDRERDDALEIEGVQKTAVKLLADLGH